jgi:hypothetical protein
MHRELRMRFCKLLVNVPVRFADRLLPEPSKPAFPQTQLVARVYERMVKVYELDCAAGTFGAVPDGNFERLLRVGWKLLARLGEDDRYYRAWLGLAFLLVAEERDRFLETVTAAQINDLCFSQWLYDLDGIPDGIILENKADFADVTLCDYLVNLARLNASLPSVPGHKEVEKTK